MSANEPSTTPQYADRVFRSVGGVMGGVLLLALAAWLGIDALVNGSGRTRLLSVAALLCVVPLITAFTVRPAVYASEDRLRIRNPFRTITLPWATVETLRAHFSSEVLTKDGAKFQLWAVPVSIRARNRANRQAAKSGAHDAHPVAAAGDKPHRAPGDQNIDDLRELAERNADREGAQGPAEVKWAYEIIAPALVGALALLVLALV
ncbi:PH domain-containing protein [Streptomyces sp. A7024]|uniref:PH domain-containing protein n=1 Tax=Streptomyces coryli TaxID=1128680 RepID=A0A6G4UF14_9ACTN|nr:PH domain-containing protein [Streptomyces coryli]NGN70331.1 PH domain-containing protein [Streptomyces coryli]